MCWIILGNARYWGKLKKTKLLEAGDADQPQQTLQSTPHSCATWVWSSWETPWPCPSWHLSLSYPLLPKCVECSLTQQGSQTHAPAFSASTAECHCFLSPSQLPWQKWLQLPCSISGRDSLCLYLIDPTVLSVEVKGPVCFFSASRRFHNNTMECIVSQCLIIQQGSASDWLNETLKSHF